LSLIITSVDGAGRNFTVKPTRTKKTLGRNKNREDGNIGTDLREISIERPINLIFSHHFHTQKKIRLLIIGPYK